LKRGDSKKMTTVENALLKQMQKLTAAMTAAQSAAGKDKNNQAAVSFQEMMEQSGGKVSAQKPEQSKAGQAPQDQQKDGGTEEVKLPGQTQETEELRPEDLTANPNAVALMDMFRPEIVETDAAPVETVVTAIPQETIQEPNMDLQEQMPEMQTAVDTNTGAEVSLEQQPKEFGQSMEEAPVETDVPQTDVEAPKENAPQQQVAQQAEQTDKPSDELPKVEVKVEDNGGEEDTHGEAMMEDAPVFHDAKTVPVKVGERFETVDTQKPEMDKQLASAIQNAAQNGEQRVEIHLAPQNLGSLVIEMTKDANGALQVVLHTANAKATGILNQHLDGLHTALQGYGHEEVRLEVQHGQESQEQHFKQADPDGHGQHQNRGQQQQKENSPENSQEFLQKLRLGLFGSDER